MTRCYLAGFNRRTTLKLKPSTMRKYLLILLALSPLLSQSQICFTNDDDEVVLRVQSVFYNGTQVSQQNNSDTLYLDMFPGLFSSVIRRLGVRKGENDEPLPIKISDYDLNGLFWNYGGTYYTEMDAFADAIHSAVHNTSQISYIPEDDFLLYSVGISPNLSLQGISRRMDMPAERDIIHVDEHLYGRRFNMEGHTPETINEADHWNMASEQLSEDSWETHQVKDMGTVPKVIGIDAYGNTIYELDENGYPVYETIYDTTHVDYLRALTDWGFYCREDWKITHQDFIKHVDLISPFYADPSSGDPWIFNILLFYNLPLQYKAKRLEEVVTNVSYTLPISFISEHTPFITEMLNLVNSEDWTVYDGAEMYLTQDFGNQGFLKSAYEKVLKGELGVPDSLTGFWNEVVDYGMEPVVSEVDAYGNIIYATDSSGQVIQRRVIHTRPLGIKDIGAIEFLEDWMVDKKTGAIVKRVKAFRIFTLDRNSLLPSVYVIVRNQ